MLPVVLGWRIDDDEPWNLLGSAVVDCVGRRFEVDASVGIVEEVDGRDGNDGNEVASLSDGARAAGGRESVDEGPFDGREGRTCS